MKWIIIFSICFLIYCFSTVIYTLLTASSGKNIRTDDNHFKKANVFGIVITLIWAGILFLIFK